MTGRAHRRGGAPVGYLSELTRVEADAIVYLRRWCEGPAGQDEVWDDLIFRLGHRHGARAADALRNMCHMLAMNGRRALLRHDVKCQCFGGDESVFANCIGATAVGDREDALLFAALLVRQDAAYAFLDEAKVLSLALAHVSQATQAPAAVAATQSAQIH
ncbi:MAG: hypothetical protein AAF415_16705 [Pseudomonadota bacterium]